MARWRKNGEPSVAELPAWDRDAAGEVRTGLATNAESREACGWVEAGVPDQVDMAQARVALLNAGLLAEVDAWVETQDEETQIFWKSRGTLRRNSARLAAAAAAKGYDAALLDQLFIAAGAVE